MKRNDYNLLSKEELINRLIAKESKPIFSPKNAYQELLKEYAYKEVEYYVVITLNCANEPIRVIEVNKGTTSKSIVGIKETFREAIKDNAEAIIIAHNHPSGDFTPSPEDKALTRRIVEAGRFIDIQVLDHIIVSKRGYYSFGDNGWPC